MKVYLSGLGRWAPEENHTIRLKADRFNIDVYMYRNSFKIWFTDSDNSSADIKDLLKAYKFMQLMSDPKAVAMEISIDGKKFKGNLSGEGFVGEFKYPVLVLDSALRIQRFFDLHDSLLATPAELESIAEQLINLSIFLHLPDTEIDMTIKFGVKAANRQLSEAECILPVSITYGQTQFVALYALSGDLEPLNNETYELHAKRRKLLYKSYYTLIDPHNLEVPDEIRTIAYEYKSETTVINLSEKFIAPNIKNPK